MGVKAKETIIHEYPLAKRGINLYKNRVELHPEECILAQNVIWRNGIVKRGGYTKFETDEVSGGNGNGS